MNSPRLSARGGRIGAVLASLLAVTLAGCGHSDSSSDDDPIVVAPSMISANGTQWVNEDGEQVFLKGVNIGNWLLQEFWMMGQSTELVDDQCTLESILTDRFGAAEKERLQELFRDNWITDRDWDLIASFGFNVVRLPFIYSLIEDDDNPYTLRDDAWQYIDTALAEAEERGLYVILDLHGVVGSQWDQHTTGCAGQNEYWSNSDFQDRTTWLWEQIAERYKDEPVVAGYSLVNEPWGTTAANLALVMGDLYDAVRAIDPNHTIILPGHNSGISAYGVPADQGMTNVAFEMHFYPGFFGWGEVGLDVHNLWLNCLTPNSVCGWNDILTARDTAFLVGEFQPWYGLGEQSGPVARATFDAYADVGWASTAWSYKVVTNSGGEGNGTWGLVTNKGNSFNERIVASNTWDCAGWNSAFADACASSDVQFTVESSGTFYLAIKSGSFSSHSVTFDEVSLRRDSDDQEMLTGGSFGSADGWTVFSVSGSQTIDFNNTLNNPTGAVGGALRISGGSANGGVYQAVDLVEGESYTLSGVFRDSGSVDTWGEIFLVPEQPQNGVDVTATQVLPQLNFAEASLEEIEALFRSFATMEYEVNEGVRDALLTDTPTDPFE